MFRTKDGLKPEESGKGGESDSDICCADHMRCYVNVTATASCIQQTMLADREVEAANGFTKNLGRRIRGGTETVQSTPDCVSKSIVNCSPTEERKGDENRNPHSDRKKWEKQEINQHMRNRTPGARVEN